MKILIPLATLPLIAMVSTVTQADNSYRCQLGPGKWVYQSQPCENGGTLLPGNDQAAPRSEQPSAQEENPGLRHVEAENQRLYQEHIRRNDPEGAERYRPQNEPR